MRSVIRQFIYFELKSYILASQCHGVKILYFGEQLISQCHVFLSGL